MRKYWEECFDKKWSLDNPFGEDAVIRLRGCARIIEEGGVIYFEIEIPQGSERWKISDTCYKLEYEVVSVKACIKDIEFQDGWPRRLKIKLEGCVNLPVWQDCETLYEGELGLGKINALSLGSISDGSLIVPTTLGASGEDHFLIGIAQRDLSKADSEKMNKSLAEI